MNTISRAIKRTESEAVKVLHIIDDLGLGGAQRQLVELLKALPQAEWEVEVIALSTWKIDYEAELLRAGIPVKLIGHSGSWSWNTLAAVYKEIRARKPDIVQTWLFTAGMYGRVGAWFAGVRNILCAIRSVDADKPSHYVTVDRLLKYITKAYTANAEAIRRVYSEREGIKPEKITRIYNGLDLSKFVTGTPDGKLRSRLKIKPKDYVFGIVGRLAPVKDHTTFIRAAAYVLEEFRDVQFVIVGSGPLEHDLKNLARDLRVADHVHFVESQTDVGPVFSSLDAVVVSSIYEGCSNVILEGMAAGKPVIATRVGGNPELVTEGTTGMLVDVGEAGALSAAMKRFALDRLGAARMGAEGRRIAEERFGLDSMVFETASLYQKVMKGARDE
ncbi:MAG: glycosyltransferase [Candidatus Omnitrophota bacterium]|nr:glycosyltransferase [Candidatus Omnitrophota bacterium]